MLTGSDTPEVNNSTVNNTTNNTTTNITNNTTIKENSQPVQKSQQKQSSNHDEGAFYSEQSGRVVSTGEVQENPDGSYWKHTGNNHWVPA